MIKLKKDQKQKHWKTAIWITKTCNKIRCDAHKIIRISSSNTRLQNIHSLSENDKPLTRTSLHIRFSFSHYFFISPSEMQSPNSRVHNLKYAWDAHILNVYTSSLNALNTCFCMWVTSICMDLCGRMFLCICPLVMSLHTLVFKFTSKHKPRQMCECSFFICCDKFSALLLWGCVLKTGSGTRVDAGVSTCSTATYSAGLQYSNESARAVSGTSGSVISLAGG